MPNILRRHWALFVALGLLYLTVAVCLMLSLSQNQGHLVYSVDDVYIHLAMAKNFALHRVWGVTKYGFTSTSSSLLYTLTLALTYALFGAREIIPLLLNILFGTLLIVWFYRVFREYTTRSGLIFLLLTIIIFITPLPAFSLIFSGMEHTLHTLLTVAFVYLSAGMLAKESSTAKENMLLLLLAVLTVAARFEGLFVVFIVCCLLLLRKRFSLAFIVGGLSLLPIVLFGLYAVANGWYFLPNSVVLKGNTISFFSLNWKGVIGAIVQYAVTGYWQMGRNPHILMLFLGAILLLYFQLGRSKEKMWTQSTMLLVIFIATSYLHMQFAKADWSDARWYARYDAYLMCLGILSIGISLLKRLPEKFEFKSTLQPRYAILALLALFVILPFILRVGILARTVRATNDIYEQQYQMAVFLREYYQDQGVAANDIGAINYFADIKCLDLFGLASMDVAVAKRSRSYDSQKIYDLAQAKNVKVAIVYDIWFAEYGGIPAQWVKVGEWTTPGNYVCGDDTVSFYAVDPAEKDALAAHLRDFSSRLPADVTQSGAYRNIAEH